MAKLQQPHGAIFKVKQRLASRPWMGYYLLHTEILRASDSTLNRRSRLSFVDL